MFTFRRIFTKINHLNTLIILGFEMPFYAVRIGRCPGVYRTWDECKVQVDKFTKPRFKKFNTEEEARAFVKGSDHPTNFPGSFKSSPAKSFSSGFPKSPKASSSKDLSTDVKLKIAEKEIQYLKEKLKQKVCEKKLLETKAEIDQLKGQGSYQGKVTHSRKTFHNSKPYQPSTPTNSSNWKQNRTTQLIDINEARQLHTDACSDGMALDDRTPVVYTDGACTNNGRGAAKAGIGVYWGPNHPLNISERLPGRQTNNRAEIHAVVKAVQQARLQGFPRLTVKTDSMFLINSMTKWLPGWKRKGWMTSEGKPVINREDFESLIEEMDGVEINWVHVRGHQGHEGNEQADKLAVKGASMPDRNR
ncbi:ribonuclease H1-like isoform X1 [Ruditapes philippinarum]|uniref:ribonuclease H1-like isoform X1 n=1 Tax=Ruditapes philippinarum TaxID=129788 RepID=UPI00295BF110|nr:ribonuclease H1-like isoform X1 [Ruditapes philippinarum]